MVNAHYTDMSTQNAVAPGLDAFSFGASSHTGARAVHSNVERKFKCRFASGAEVIVAFASGAVYDYRILRVMASNGSAISSVSNLVIGIR